MQSSSSSGSASSSDFSNDLSNMASAVDLLPTVHEDIELMVNPPAHAGYPSGWIFVSQTPEILLQLKSLCYREPKCRIPYAKRCSTYGSINQRYFVIVSKTTVSRPFQV